MTRIFNAFALAGIFCGIALGTGAEAHASYPPRDAAAYWAISPLTAHPTVPAAPSAAPQAEDPSTITGGPAGGLATGN